MHNRGLSMNVSCQNCGHGSHCGSTIYGNVSHNTNRNVNEQPGGYEICRSCRCEYCTKEET